MAEPILRENFSSRTIISVSTSGAAPTIIGFSAFGGGMLHFYTNGNAAVTLYFYSIHTDASGTDSVHQLVDPSGAVVTRAVNLTGNKAIAIPDECFGSHKIGIMASAAGVMMHYTLKG